MIKYRIGKPLWQLAYRLGLGLYYTVIIKKDECDDLYYVSSSDIPGLSTEGSSLEELKANIADCALLLLSSHYPKINNPNRLFCYTNLSRI
ncbi:MAG: type II toxin-antitoxin system HicB family antitoxin [Succinivibrio sp.]